MSKSVDRRLAIQRGEKSGAEERLHEALHPNGYPNPLPDIAETIEACAALADSLEKEALDLARAHLDDGAGVSATCAEHEAGGCRKVAARLREVLRGR